ncbi:hypothetical protein [Maritalea sp.]
MRGAFFGEVALGTFTAAVVALVYFTTTSPTYWAFMNWIFS